MLAGALNVEKKNAQIDKTVRENRGRLLRFIRKFVKRQDDAEDIVQDVFYQLVNGYEQIQSFDQITSWLYQVARNKATDNHRKMKPSAFSELGPADENAPLMLEEILPDPDSLPDRLMMGQIIWDNIYEQLELMPEAQRQVFIWHEFDKKSFKEMSEMTGETVNTLISRKRYAVLQLREHLTDLYNELIYD